MSKRTAGVVIVPLLIAIIGMPAAADDKDEAIKKDAKLMEGVWLLQSFENNGKQTASDQIKNIKLTVKGDRYLVDFGDQKMELSFKIDPTKNPKTIDFIMTKGEQKGVTLGIYELGAGTLKICRSADAGQLRPTAFSTKEGSGTVMAIYKREKK